MLQIENKLETDHDLQWSGRLSIMFPLTAGIGSSPPQPWKWLHKIKWMDDGRVDYDSGVCRKIRYK